MLDADLLIRSPNLSIDKVLSKSSSSSAPGEAFSARSLPCTEIARQESNTADPYSPLDPPALQTVLGLLRSSRLHTTRLGCSFSLRGTALSKTKSQHRSTSPHAALCKDTLVVLHTSPQQQLSQGCVSASLSYQRRCIIFCFAGISLTCICCPLTFPLPTLPSLSFLDLPYFPLGNRSPALVSCPWVSDHPVLSHLPSALLGDPVPLSTLSAGFSARFPPVSGCGCFSALCWWRRALPGDSCPFCLQSSFSQ